jgi:hypothetical protein
MPSIETKLQWLMLNLEKVQKLCINAMIKLSIKKLHGHYELRFRIHRRPNKLQSHGLNKDDLSTGNVSFQHEIHVSCQREL